MYLLLVLCVLLSGHTWAQNQDPSKLPDLTNMKIEGPVKPTRALIPKTKTPDLSIEDLDLPYKPKEFEDEDVVLDEKDGTPDEISALDLHGKPKEPPVDWSKIPFVPSKAPLLKPAGDPEIR